MIKDLIIFEMANNHQGDINHAIKIIETYANLANKKKINAAIKLQFRDLPNFISKRELRKKTNKHVSRFLKTKLTDTEFSKLCEKIKKKKLKLIITPFDEVSVEKAVKFDVDIIKIASCSTNDWPLIDKISKQNKPIIFSTGGQSIKDTDKTCSFLNHRNQNFSILHCVSTYPTKINEAQLNQIQILKKRYSNIVVGYSGHEDPDNLTICKVACGLGARIFERHVGIPTNKIKLNAYSMNVKQTEMWIEAIKQAKLTISDKKLKLINAQEKKSIKLLQRGVFLNKSIARGKKIKSTDVYFAFPIQKNQMQSGNFFENVIASKNYKKDSPLTELIKTDIKKEIRSYIHSYKGMFSEAGIQVKDYLSMEISHHYGIKKFKKYGVFMVTFINNLYCKKIIALLPGQKNPKHRHFKKKETFIILRGNLKLNLNDINYNLLPGSIITINRGDWHSFHSEDGCLFEEISTEHIVGDSEYKDKNISIDSIQRKTPIENW